MTGQGAVSPERIAEVAARLADSVALADDFALHVLSVPGASAADQLMDALASTKPRRLRLSRLAAPTRGDGGAPRSDALIDALLRPLLEQHARSRPGAWLIDASSADARDVEAWRGWLRSFNVKRDVVASRLRTPVVLVVPEWLFADLAKQAPDLWSVRSLVEVIGPVADVRSQRSIAAGELDIAASMLDVPVVMPIATQVAIDELLHDRLPELERAGDERGRALAVMALAGLQARIGALNEARRLLREEALPVLSASGDRGGVARCLRLVAEVSIWLGDFDEALQILRDRVVPELEALADGPGRALALDVVADVYDGRGAYDDARSLRERDVLPVLVASADVVSVARVTCKILVAMDRSGESAVALSRLDAEVLPVLRGEQAAEALADALLAKGVMCGALGDFFAADVALREAGALALRVEALDVSSRVSRARAEHAARCGDQATTAHLLLQAYGQAWLSGRPALVGPTAMLAAQVFVARGQDRQAVAALMRAEEAARRVGAVELAGLAREQRAAIARG